MQDGNLLSNLIVNMIYEKLYNNTLLQLILALCTFSFVACQEFDIDSQPEGPLNIQIDALRLIPLWQLLPATSFLI